MATETTFPAISPPAVSRWERVRLADQRLAFAALDRITELHPNLPAAYITLSFVYPDLVEVQAQAWHHLEAWRIALNVPASEVGLGNCEPESEHIEFATSVDGARVRVYVLGAGRSAPVVDVAVSA